MPAGANQIGVTSAVLPQATGTQPQTEPRVLQVGVDVVAEERIVTGEVGKAHLLFRDGSALTVGPNADVVLDQFVYDAESKTGSIALSASKGLLRFVGGRISKSSPVQIRTPSATIGIRGGIAILAVGAQALTAKFLFGDEMTITGSGQTVTVTRPGFQVTVPTGGAPAEPTPIPNDELTGDVSDLEGNPEQTGETEGLVSDSDVGDSQLGSLGSTNAPTNVGPADPGEPPLPNVGQSDVIVDVVESQGEVTGTTGGGTGGGTGGDTGTIPNTPPSIAGDTAATTVAVNVLPFATITITDPDLGEVVTVTVAINDTATGSFTGASVAAAGFVDQGGGVFSFTGTPEQAQTAIQQLVFAPDDGRVATGQSETVTFAIVVSDGDLLTAAQQSLMVSCASLCTYNLGGRVKVGTSTSVGTDGSSQAIVGFSSLIGGQRFLFTTADGTFVLSAPSSGGEFTVTSASLPASFGAGPFTGSGFLAPNGDFILYELTGSRILVFGGTPNTSFTPSSTFQAATYSLRDDFTLGGSQIPFIPRPLQANIITPVNPTMTLLLGTQPGGDQFFLAGNILVDGTGASQGIAGSVLLGQALNSGPGTMFLRGKMRGTVDAGTTGFQPTRFAGSVATADDGNGFDFFGADGPRYTVLEAANVSTADIDQGGGGVLPTQGSGSSGGTIFPNVPAMNQQASLGLFAPAAGTANNQRISRTIKGYAGGISLERNASNLPVEASIFVSDVNAGPSGFDQFQITTDAATNRVGVTADIFTTLNGFSAGNDTNTIIGFGGLSDAGLSAFLDNSTFAAVEPSGPVTVDGNASGTMVGFLVTNDQVTFAGGALPGDVTLCTCSQLQWGFFSATLFDASTSYEIALAQWVAGEPALIAQVTGFNGIATYQGHVVAAIANGSSNAPGGLQRYTALGSFAIDLNFSSGVLSVAGGTIELDGAAYGLTDPGSQGLPVPEFQFDINSGFGRSGRGSGSLFGSGTPPAQAGGNFALAQGGIDMSDPTNYQASGIFAADLTGTMIPN